ncbi:hypothetical protein SLU01_21130 [Sporosarcina luteola]|uniref:Uncharacterized protein n=1 Tax=Sporosarcina luteola TaxID=582850 RepID=A0A511Z8M7_9BACL|nr:hypothetical protein [Sporosarcina luteola]GEN83801.1 hypothetical protein SLU01_21130 [Sporosarcina luteola]
MHGAENPKRSARPFFSSNIAKWLLHLTAFVVFQILFLLTDGSRFWNILNLNKAGEKVVAFLHPFFNQFLIYSSEHLNYVTAVWGVVVVVDGIFKFVMWLKSQRADHAR